MTIMMTFNQTEDAQLANETGASPSSAGARKGRESQTRDNGASGRETRRVVLGSPSLCPGLSPTPWPLLTVAEGTVSGAGTTQASADPGGLPQALTTRAQKSPETRRVTAVTRVSQVYSSRRPRPLPSPGPRRPRPPAAGSPHR